MHRPHEAWALSPAGLGTIPWSGHYPLQVCARPRVGSCKQLRWPPRPAGQSDVLRVACILGDEEAATGCAKSTGPPPINRQGPKGAKGADFVVRAESGGEGLGMDDRGRVPWRLALSKELGKETVRNRSIWLICHIEGRLLRACT